MSVLTALWRSIFAESPFAAPAREAYLRVVAQAREASFYRSFGVPDTVDGRFDMITLHAVLLIRRIKGQGPDSDRFGREFMSYLFADMDRNLREMGTGDMGVGRKIKAMADAFYGRAKVYQAALDSGAPTLEEALERNVFADVPEGGPGPGLLAADVRHQVAALEAQALADILGGNVRFDPPAQTTGAAIDPSGHNY
ncbi:MAG: ubiquinol-cytochrome C chaperone family protein [Alphaproteobacteria bacterium]